MSKRTPFNLLYDHVAAELVADDRDTTNVTARVASVDVDNCEDPEVIRADGERLALCWNTHDSLVETLQWVRANYAGGSTAEINARIDDALSKAQGTQS